MDEKRFAQTLATLRRARGFTQESLADHLGVTPQAVSKWERGHSLPETALLPDLARLLDISLDHLFRQGDLLILSATWGDGLAAADVTARLGRLAAADTLTLTPDDAVLSALSDPARVPWLLVHYQTRHGQAYAAARAGTPLALTADDPATYLPADGLTIHAGSYGARAHSYDILPRIRHLSALGYQSWPADHHAFPSDPANDDMEFLTLVYLNADGLHAATCAEGERLALAPDGRALTREAPGGAVVLRATPALPPFGAGMECSWAAALWAALVAMGERTTYDEVMGVSGACYRLAFCRGPAWDYSAVDGLVAYDYATPGLAAYGYQAALHGHIEKAERAAHRQRILRELRGGMPVLGINLRVAHEWGVICGYARDGEDLFCRTKYDADIDPATLPPEGFPYVDNWPFLLLYFDGRTPRPSPREALLTSLSVFVDGLAQTAHGGYAMGLAAYDTWRDGLLDDAWFDAADDDALAWRFSVNQFCGLALMDARGAAHRYLSASASLIGGDAMARLVAHFDTLATLSAQMHRLLDAGEALGVDRVRAFFTPALRAEQAALLAVLRAEEVAAGQAAQEILSL